VWVSEVRAPAADAAPHLALVNGQTRDVYGDLAAKPGHSGKLLSWLSDLV
jgi:hypothetical protein